MRPSTREIRQTKWVKNWEGKWSLLTCTYFGHQYTKTMRNPANARFQTAILVARRRHSACYFPEKEFNDVFQKIAGKVSASRKSAAELCNELKKEADEITS